MANKKSKKKSAEQKKAEEELKKAEQDKAAKEQKRAEREAKLDDLVEKFEKLFGRDEKLQGWQALCRALGEPVGDTISQCKKNLKNVWVNIFDFIAAREAGIEVPRRKSLNNLRNYSIRTGKIFPLRKAKDSPLLRGLLVPMFGFNKH